MKRTEGRNFSVIHPDKGGPAKSEITGIVSGETSGETSETQKRQERRFEALKRLEESVQADKQLSALFGDIDDANPLHRTERLIDALSKMRMDLEDSDAHPDLKRLRGNFLSGVINRLRELL